VTLVSLLRRLNRLFPLSGKSRSGTAASENALRVLATADRRAATIASLARRISERSVKRGLRTTLLTQAKRLERLAEARLKDFPAGAEDEDQHED